MGQAEPVLGRVEDWRADGRVRWKIQPLFALVRSPAPIITFPAPASSNAACGFPALRFPACFTSRVMRPIQPSPSRISVVSGRAVRSAPFSSRLCLPCRQSRYRQQGRFPPPALPGFPGTTSPSATLSPVSRFPGAAGYTAYLCSADFLNGARRASPVAWRVLVTVPSLPPRRSTVAPQPVCATPCCFRPRLEDSASGPSIFRGHPCVHSRYGPATRRPPLTVVVSMGFSSSVSLLPAIQTTGLWLLPRRVYPPLNAPAFAGRT